MPDRIIANGQELELAGSKIALTKQIANLGSTKDRNTNYTNRIRLPWTAKNLQALGMTHQTTSGEDAAYIQTDAQIIAKGIPVETFGFLRVLSVAKDIEIAINGPEYGFFKAIEGLTLYDLDWSDNDHTYNQSTAGAAATRTEGYMYPVVDYGALTSTAIDLNLYRPGMHLHTILTKIATTQGYTLEGDILTDDLYLRALLIKGGKKFEHSDRYAQERSFQLVTTSPSTNIYDFPVTVSDQLIGIINFGGSTRYTATRAITLQSIEFRGTISVFNKYETFGNTINDAKVHIRLNGTTSLATQLITTTGEITLAVGATPLVIGDYLEVIVTSSATVVSGQDQPEVEVTFSTATFYTPDITRAITIGEEITAEAFLPKMNQKTLFKGFLLQFGLIPIVDGLREVITLRHFQDIVDNKATAIDWSSKIVRPESVNPGQWYVSKTTKIGKYGRKNYLEFKEDETLLNPDFGRGEIASNDETLPDAETIFTLPWAATESEARTGHNELTALVPIYVETFVGSGEYKADENPKDRLIFYTKKSLSVTYTDAGAGGVGPSGGLVPWGKFIDPAEPKNIGFSNNLQARHYSILEELLQDAQKLIALFNLTPADVALLDHFIPIWIDKFGGYYYVNKLMNYVSGNISRVELIKI